MLVPIEYLTTRKFYEASQGIGGRIYIPNGRISFETAPGAKTRPSAFGSVVIKIQKGWEVEQIDLKKILGE